MASWGWTPRAARMSKIASLGVFLAGGVWFSNEPPPVVFVNEDNGLLATWQSERTMHADLPPECAFFNFTVRYDAGMCSHFTIARSHAASQVALRRALRCAGTHGTDCILSPEVGFAIPAAFVYDHELGQMGVLIAPKLLKRDEREEEGVAHVRIAPPDGDGIHDTHTVKFQSAIEIEYMDRESRALRTLRLRDDAAFCVQLLRESFEDACWRRLD